MLDMYPIIAVIAVAVVAAVFALINRLMATRAFIVRSLSGMHRSLANMESINRAYGQRLDRLDRSRAFSAEQEARISSIEKRCAQKLCQSPDRSGTVSESG